MPSPSRIKPEWPSRIGQLLRKHSLTQAALAKRLGVSSATVSRWLKGTHEPTGEAYVSLGNLAGPPEDLYFWERAGINTSSLPEIGSRISAPSIRIKLTDFKLVPAQDVSSKVLSGNANAVAIPLLNVTCYEDPIPPEEDIHFSESVIEEVLTAPLDWCPHPSGMVCLHLNGISIFPLILSESIIAVDMQVTDRDVLKGKVVLASHRDLGFKVARLERLPSADILISQNHKYMPVDISEDPRWKIMGQGCWWLSRDTEI
jgi:transcriptional regulator with XRE-family HTH domain